MHCLCKGTRFSQIMDEQTETTGPAWLSRDPEPFKQGAEARLYRCNYFGRKAILKDRFVKKHRYEMCIFRTDQIFLNVMATACGFAVPVSTLLEKKFHI